MRKHEPKRRDGVQCSDDVVVLIHGLWMPAAVMALLARRLHRAGWTTCSFTYSSRHATLRRNAAALAEFVAAIDASRIHFVAHSLGGLVVARLLSDFPDQRPGRVVLLGTPYRGSWVAQRLSRHGWGRRLCGISLEEGLLGDGPHWPGGRELGVIAGSLAVGVGWLAPGLAKPNDGTVAVAETGVAEARDAITLRVSHSGLVFSAAVARQVIQFLATGRFNHGGP